MIGLGGSSHEATGCNLFRDAAACVSRERVERDLDLSAACTARDGRGRCLRRSRASRARRGQPQRMCDGRGMYCGRSGGGRVLVGAIYSHIRSDHFLSLFRLTGATTRPYVVYVFVFEDLLHSLSSVTRSRQTRTHLTIHLYVMTADMVDRAPMTRRGHHNNQLCAAGACADHLHACTERRTVATAQGLRMGETPAGERG